MKLYLFFGAALWAFTAQATAQLQPIPHLEKRHGVTQLIVDGKPWLSIGGELLNNAASTADHARPLWPALAKANLNTVLVGAGWSWIEPEEGKFDFSSIDAALRDARKSNLKIVLLWFGSWKNGTSSYAPAWVKRNWQKYPIARDQDGKGREILSALSTVNRDADARAYTALLRHVREIDADTRTVLMIQLENEVGVLGDSRDRSNEANQAFASAVPLELTSYLQKSTLLPETRKLWESAGGKTSGSWEQVFGKGPTADEAFMAWHYARYMNWIAEQGKKVYPLPVFVNAWLVQPNDKKGGDYPSGGPQAHNHDIWRAAAPKIDILAPDIYLPGFAAIAEQYSRNGNPLFIPETRADAANAFLAFGQLNAQMYSPFAIETREEPAFAKAYAVLRQLAPVILEHQGTGSMKAVTVEPGAPPRKLQLGNYIFDCATGRGWRAPADAAAKQGYAILIQTGPDDFWIAGANLNIRVASKFAEAPQAGLARVEEGRIEKGAWIVSRYLAGDDIGNGGDDRASLQLHADPGILRFSVYSYR